MVHDLSGELESLAVLTMLEKLYLPFTLYRFFACFVWTTQSFARRGLGVQNIAFWRFADHPDSDAERVNEVVRSPENSEGCYLLLVRNANCSFVSGTTESRPCRSSGESWNSLLDLISLSGTVRASGGP